MASCYDACPRYLARFFGYLKQLGDVVAVGHLIQSFERMKVDGTRDLVDHVDGSELPYFEIQRCLDVVRGGPATLLLFTSVLIRHTSRHGVIPCSPWWRSCPCGRTFGCGNSDDSGITRAHCSSLDENRWYEEWV